MSYRRSAGWVDVLRPVDAFGMDGACVKTAAQRALTLKAIQSGEQFYYGEAGGYCGDDVATVIDNIDRFQPGKKASERIGTGKDCVSIEWVWETGAANLRTYSDGDVLLWAADQNSGVVEKLVNIVANNSRRRKADGSVYVIVSEAGGPSFAPLGIASVPLERGNYSHEALAAYDKAVDDLRSVSPSGRLVIFDGQPGTGKTFIIRGMIDDVEDATFVLVPPSMVDSLASPELIPMLIRFKGSDSAGPIVFILEDADNVLVPRAKDNLSMISTLLNLGSGMLGSLLDLRVVATTNSPATDIDPALMREGRLSTHATVGPLSKEGANAVVSRLVGRQVKEFDEAVPLAKAYSAARKLGWSPASVKGESRARIVEDREGVYVVPPGPRETDTLS